MPIKRSSTDPELLFLGVAMSLLRRGILILLAVAIGAAISSAQSQESGTGKGTASIKGRVTANGNPVRGVVVTVEPDISNKSRFIKYFTGKIPIPKATSDADGRYFITDLEAGRYSVQLSAPALVGTRVSRNSEDKNSRGMID